MEQERGEVYSGQRSNISCKVAQAEMNNTDGEGRNTVWKIVHVYSYTHIKPDCFTVKLKTAKHANF